MSLKHSLLTSLAVLSAVSSVTAADQSFLADYGIATVTDAVTAASGTSPASMLVTVSGTPTGSAEIANIAANAVLTSINGVNVQDPGPVNNGIPQNLSNAAASVTNDPDGIITVSFLPATPPPGTLPQRVTLVNLAKAKAVVSELGISFNDAANLLLAAPAGNATVAGLRSGDKVTQVSGTDVSNENQFDQYAYLALSTSQSVTLTINAGNATPAKLLSVTVNQAAPSAAPAASPASVKGVSNATGPPVDYPPYLDANEVSRAVIKAPLREDLEAQVVSARVELYYFRDAARAAQIINRRVQSYNRAAVTAAEQVAETARGANLDAEDVLERKQSEAQREADLLLQMERTLAETVSQYRQALAKNPPVESETNALKSSIETLLPNISQQRQKVTAAEAEVLTAEQNEARTARTRFQAEVSAGTTDPDTYVPGNPNSWDPVAQVSISVIGEGVLFLRGPRQGVIEIRKMLEEIDHPVGQVKIGVMTVQLNGESNFRMDNTVRQVEGNLSLGRFLTYVTGQIFARSVSETARDIAARTKTAMNVPADPAAPFSDALVRNLSHLGAQSDDLTRDSANRRRQAYLQAFFGDDFLWALYETDPNTPLLDPLNKIVSLNSTDTLTFAEGLIYTGLAKDSVKDQIMARFQHYLMTDLPEREFEWIRTTGAHKWYDVRWWGDGTGAMKSVYKNAFRNYKFAATTSFFKRETTGNDELNPLQRQLIRLVQLITVC